MEKLIDMKDLLQDIRDGDNTLRVIGYAGLGQQADEREMGQALLFVTRCLDDILDRADKMIDEVIAEEQPDRA